MGSNVLRGNAMSATLTVSKVNTVSQLNLAEKLVSYRTIVESLAPANVIDLVTCEPHLEVSGVALARRTPTP